GPARERDRAPGLEGLRRRPDRRVDLLGRGEVDLAGLDTERRVVDGTATPGGPFDPRSVDPVRDPADLARALLGELIRDFCHEESVALGSLPWPWSKVSAPNGSRSWTAPTFSTRGRCRARSRRLRSRARKAATSGTTTATATST